jgi:phage baseplate assembly protein W
MAYIVKNVDVLDLKPSTGVGISVPFDGATGINTTYTTTDTIKSNLINFLLTGKRERVMNPSFGSGLREILFEQLTADTTAIINDLIKGGIEEFFPQVVIEDLNITLDEFNQTINIYLKYTIINTNIEDELQLNLNLQNATI